MPSYQLIDLGSGADTDSGDTLIQGATKINANAALHDSVIITGSQDLWANRPSAATAGQGAIFKANDLGSSLFISNGTRWLPSNGRLPLFASAVDVSHAGGASETAFATLTIPAGLITPTSLLRLKMRFTITTSGTITRTLRVRIGGLAGTQIYSEAFNTASTITSATIEAVIGNQNAANAQATSGVSWFSNNTQLPQRTASAFDTSGATDIAITGELAGGTTSGLMVLNNYSLELIAVN